MSDPLVSVLLPIFNAEDTVEAALRSLSAQSLTDFEIVAVDDGSSDRTARLLAEYAADESRLRVIRADHAGLIDALNLGLTHCRGRLVARMDADDIALPGRLALQAEFLDRHPEVSIVATAMEITSPSGEVGEGFRIYGEWQNGLITHDDICREIFIESPITHPTVVLRRDELAELGAYQDRGWAEDYDLWLRYYAAGKRFAKIPEVLLQWREHPQRLTRTDSRYSVENFLRAKAHYLLAGPLRDRDALFVWGAGRTGRRLSKHLIRGGRTPEFFIDIAPDRIGGTLRRVPVIGPEDLADHWNEHRSPILLAAVASRGARALIRNELDRQGLTETEDFLCVA